MERLGHDLLAHNPVADILLARNPVADILLGRIAAPNRSGDLEVGGSR